MVLVMLVPASHATQLYRWTDAQGQVHYTDQPPPVAARQSVQKNFSGNVIEGGESYALRQARSRHPVSLYTSPDCGLPCEDASRLLARRGIPHTTHNPQSQATDQQALRKLTGRMNLPVLVVGRQTLEGYQTETWNHALDAAGYPGAAPLPAQPAKSVAGNPPAAPDASAKP
jgi:glutaredoxin